MKKSHACSFPDVDKYIRKRFEQYCVKGVPISDLILQKKKRKKLKTLLKNLDLLVSKQVTVGLKVLKQEMELSSENFLESGYVPISVTDDWLKKLPSLNARI